MARERQPIVVRTPKPRNIDEFINGEASTSNIQASDVETQLSTSNIQASDVPAGLRGVVTRAKGEKLARVSVYLPVEVAAKLRRHCFETGTEMSAFASEAIARSVRKLPG